MSKKGKNTLWFSVGTQTAYGSSVWRLWTSSDDTYLTSRSHAAVARVSLHKSGVWRLAWTEKSGLIETDTRDRVIHRWHRPAPFRLDWTRGLDVVVPRVFGGVFPRDTPDSKDPILWSPVPEPGTCWIFTILFASTNISEARVREALRPEDALMGVLPLRSQGSVVLARRARVLLERESRDLQFIVESRARPLLASLPQALGASLFSAGNSDSGDPYILDLPVAKDAA